MTMSPSKDKSCYLSNFDSGRVAFGRHETFPLRFGWLTKGFQALLKNPYIFDQEDAVVILGVGKNMVRAIRYWMLASKIVEMDINTIRPTELGKTIFSEEGWDPYLEDEATIWLIHWLLTSNWTDATSISWFFNQFYKAEFTSNDIVSGLKDFVRERIKIKVSANTLKQDVTTLLRMYAPSTDNKQSPIEEALDSPLSLLDLINKIGTGNKYQSKPEYRSLPLGILGFAVSELFEYTNLLTLPIKTLLRGDGRLPGPGAIFRLTEDCLITKLEELIEWVPGHYEMRETAGIYQIYVLRPLKPLTFLEAHYTNNLKECAA